MPAIAGRPVFPYSGLVRYEGEYYSLNPAHPKPPHRAAFDDALKSCNDSRQASGLPPAMPAVPADVLANADRSTEIVYYDNLSGASRWDRRHVYPVFRLVPYGLDSAPQCNQFDVIYHHATRIISSDGNVYSFVFDPKTGSVLRIDGGPRGNVPAVAVPWPGTWARRTIAGEECVQMPAVGDGSFGAERCNWSAFAEIKFGDLPIALEKVDHLGTTFHHRSTAVSATAGALTPIEWQVRKVDDLPAGVPVVMHSGDVPTDGAAQDKPMAADKPFGKSSL